MKVRFSLLLLGSLALAACGPESAPPAEEAAPAAEETGAEAELDAVRTQYVTLYNAGDANGVAALFMDSAMALWADGAISTGRPAILENIQTDLAGSPQLQLTTGETLVVGDNAVARGRYTVTATPEGAPAMSFSGNYLTHFVRQAGEWRISGVITNFDAPPPEGVEMQTFEGEAPPDEGTMKELIAAYEQAVNAGDWAAVGAMYTDDAYVSFSNADAMTGPAAVQARWQERFGTTPPTMEIHDVGTLDLGNGYALDGGWYTFTATTPEGNIQQGGTYLSVVQQQPDGSWKIHWQVTNGQPQPAG